MSTAIIIHPDVQDRDLILKCLEPSILNLNLNSDSNLLNLPGVTRLGLMFHNELKCRIPFFENTVVKVPIPVNKVKVKSTDTFQFDKFISRIKTKEDLINNLKFYSLKLVNLLKQLVIQNGSFTLTLISCSMNSGEFLKETAIVQGLTGAKIEYSLNQTGNSDKGSTDWILESNNENLIGTFFTNMILTWNHTLFYNTSDTILKTHSDILNYFNTAGGAGTLTYSRKKYKLHNDVTVNPYNGSTKIHVMLNDDEIFDGQNYTMTYTSTSGNVNTRGLFIFNCRPGSKATIKNLKVASINGSVINYSGGGLVRGQQGNFIINNCHNLSMNCNSPGCGGLIGFRCNNFIVLNCTNSAYLNGTYCGGIIGISCTGFTVEKCKNLSNNNFIEQSSGGIVGLHCAKFKISECYNYVNLNTDGSSGITGPECYNFEIKNCKNKGLYESSEQSGIIGAVCYNFKVINCKNYTDISESSGGIIGFSCTNFEVSNCVNIGNIDIGSGGIIGYACSNLIVRNCKNYGNINGYLSGGITGAYTGINVIVASVYVKILNCTNYGQINAFSLGGAGGITGGSLGFVTSNVPNTVNTELLIHGCINNGRVNDATFTSGGLCGAGLGLASNPNGQSATIKISECSTRHGSLIGSNTLFNNSFSAGDNIACPTQLIISDSGTSKKVSLIVGFDTTATDPDNTCSAVYIKPNGKKVNLLKHQSFVSRK